MERFTMRGYWISIVLLAGVMTMAGCGSRDERPDRTHADISDSLTSDTIAADLVASEDFDRDTFEILHSDAISETLDGPPFPLDIPGDTVAADSTPETFYDVKDDGYDDASVDAIQNRDVLEIHDEDSSSPLDTMECADTECNIVCPSGYRTDPAGCPLCRCRECASAADCADLGGFLCPDPTCTDSGDCVCGCLSFEDLDYGCPDGTIIAFGRCSDAGVTYMKHIEEECPTLCGPSTNIDIGCPDGTNRPWCTCQPTKCRPVCREIGTRSEGWYDPCGGGLIEYAGCRGHAAACVKIGSKSEGWIGTDGSFLGWAVCAPSWSCATIDETCGDTSCHSMDDGMLVCPDGRSTPFCSCDQGLWTCHENPAMTCAGRWRGCVTRTNPLPEDGYLQCCAGLVRLRAVMDSDGTCVTDTERPAGSCSECGDGACETPENRCNCPEDCLDGQFPGSSGSPCLRDTECPWSFSCVGATAGEGVCTPG
ncbi:MAG TPA: hypothetical protein PLY68_02305 [Myxococcota bacterium]|nr:hypothetical protein [Myxococcota bacterium]HQP95011.1 hypothetical protein [Myxococcota bacterium]